MTSNFRTSAVEPVNVLRVTGDRAQSRESAFTRLFYVFHFSVNKHLPKDVFHLLVFVVRYPSQFFHQSCLVDRSDLIQDYPTLFPLEP